jgi:glycine cleavage system aminomethyltransferase T
VKYHASAEGYDVTCVTDPQSLFRGGADPRLFRYQVQGPLAADLVARVFGGPLPPVKFFHSVPVTLAGRRFRALRHNMAGQDGYEFIGDWQDGAAVKEALLTAGEPLGLVHVGALAYPTSGVESGWIAAPVPAIYTSPDLAGYRKHLGLYSFEGQNPLYGSFFSEDIEDYYASPYELGYGRSISFGHDFIGRDSLLKARDTVRRTKVTLVFDPADAALAIAPGQELALSNGRYRVESGGALAGQAYHTASLTPANAVLSLAVIDRQYAAPGTEVTVSWGEHPGARDGPGRGPGLPAHPRHRGARALQRARPHQLPGGRLTGAALSP